MVSFRIRAVLALAGVLLATVAAAATKDVQFRDGTLTVRLEQAPLADVIAEVARVTGAEVRGDVLAPRDLNLTFDRVPLKEGLERLLDAQNFTLVYADDGRLKAIELKALREEQLRRPAAGTSPSADGAEPAYQRAAFRAFAGRERVKVDPELAKLLGDERVNWDVLGNTTYGARDAKTRRAAVRAAMKAIAADAALRTAIEDATRGVSDAELASFVRERTYNRAEELVRNIARETDLPEFEARARGVLRELRKIPFQGTVPWEFVKPIDKPNDG